MKKEKKGKTPFEAIQQAEVNYLKEWEKLTENYHKLWEYVKPFVEQDKKHKEIASNIQLALIALPLSHVIITTIHMANLEMLKTMTQTSMPPLKLECPKCKTVVWDVSELNDFLDPKGNIYKKEKKDA